MNIVYFVIGNSVVIHMQVEFSIRTMLAQMSDEDHFYVVTDTPSSYSHIPQLTTVEITQEDIKKWRGPHDFFWRVKIMALLDIAQRSPNKDLMYLDGDTYLHGDLNAIKELVRHNKGLMHKDEGCPGDMKQKSLMMWQSVNGRTYGGVTIMPHHHMWNAGVVAIPAAHLQETLDLALAVCDGMLDDGAEPVVVEQFALSIALFENVEQMVEAKWWIGHYWHNKYYWSSYIAKFFVKAYRYGLSLEQQLDRIRHTNLKWEHRKILVKRTIAKFTGRLY